MIQHFLNVFRKFAQFSGRSTRSEYWWFALGYLIIYYALLALSMYLAIPAFGIAALVFSVIALIPSIAVAVRRMHDVGKSGWFCLIPIYNIILACTDSQPETNKYGPNPKADGQDVSDHLVT